MNKEFIGFKTVKEIIFQNAWIFFLIMFLITIVLTFCNYKKTHDKKVLIRGILASVDMIVVGVVTYLFMAVASSNPESRTGGAPFIILLSLVGFAMINILAFSFADKIEEDEDEIEEDEIELTLTELEKEIILAYRKASETDKLLTKKANKNAKRNSSTAIKQ